jgi:hypothetical protein
MNTPNKGNDTVPMGNALAIIFAVFLVVRLLSALFFILLSLVGNCLISAVQVQALAMTGKLLERGDVPRLFQGYGKLLQIIHSVMTEALQTHKMTDG